MEFTLLNQRSRANVQELGGVWNIRSQPDFGLQSPGDPSMENKTAADLAKEYLRLGGTRKSANDDNLVSTRKWDDEPQAAQEYWTEHIQPLDEDRKRELISLLPSISQE
jgi:hypothetical protein